MSDLVCMKKTVSFGEKSDLELAVRNNTKRGSLSQLTKSESSEEAESIFNAGLNLEIERKFIPLFSAIATKESERVVTEALVKMLEVVKDSEDSETKSALLFFCELLLLEKNPFRKKEWQNIRSSLGVTDTKLDQCLEDLAQQVAKSGSPNIQEAFAGYNTALEANEKDAFESELQLYIAEEERVQLHISNLEKEAEQNQADQSDDFYFAEESNIQDDIAMWQQALKKAQISKFIYLVNSQEEGISQKCAALKNFYQERNLEIAEEEAPRRPDLRSRIIKAEEEFEIQKLQSQFNGELIKLIRSSYELAREFGDDLENEEKKFEIAQNLPLLEKEISYLKRVQSNPDQEAESFNDEIAKYITEGCQEAKNNLCKSVQASADNLIKFEFIECLKAGKNFSDDRHFAAAIEGNLEIKKALLDFDNASLDEVKESEREQKIKINQQKGKIIAAELALLEIEDSDLRKQVLEELEQERQILISAEEDFVDRRIENFLDREWKRAEKEMDYISSSYAAAKDQSKSRVNKFNITIKSLEESGNKDGLALQQYWLKARETELQKIEKAEEKKLLICELKCSEEISAFDQLSSYPLAGRKFSNILAEESERRVGLKEELSSLEADLVILDRRSLRLKKREKEIKLNDQIQEFEGQIRSNSRADNLELSDAKIILCNQIRDCDDNKAKKLLISYLEESRAIPFKELPDSAIGFQDANIRKIFINYELAITGRNIAGENLEEAQVNLIKNRIERRLAGEQKAYDHELVFLIAALPRSKTDFDATLWEEADKIRPNQKEFVSLPSRSPKQSAVTSLSLSDLHKWK